MGSPLLGGWLFHHLCTLPFPFKTIPIFHTRAHVPSTLIFDGFQRSSTIYITFLICKLIFNYRFVDNWEHLILVCKINIDGAFCCPTTRRIKIHCDHNSRRIALWVLPFRPSHRPGLEIGRDLRPVPTRLPCHQPMALCWVLSAISAGGQILNMLILNRQPTIIDSRPTVTYPQVRLS